MAKAPFRPRQHRGKIQAKTCPVCSHQYTVRKLGECPSCGVPTFYIDEKPDHPDDAVVYDKIAMEWAVGKNVATRPS